jgi:hypothetical protein
MGTFTAPTCVISAGQLKNDITKYDDGCTVVRVVLCFEQVTEAILD